MNNEDLKKKVSKSCIKLLKEKGYIAPVDILLEVGVIDKKRYLDWKNGRVPYLEKVCSGSLNKMNLILKTIDSISREMKLKPSFTYYKRIGSKIKLQFSKTNSNYLENKYATHHVGLQYKQIPSNVTNN